MEKLTELIAQLTKLDTEIDALLTHNELTEEQEKLYQQLDQQRGKAQAAVKREKDRIAREKERTELNSYVETEKTAVALVEAKEKHAVRIGRQTSTDVPQLGESLREREKNKFSIPIWAQAYGGLRNFRGQKNGLQAEERAFRFGMFALALLAEQFPYRFKFPRATKFYEVEFKNPLAAASQESDAFGTHFTIPDEFSSDIIDLREQYGVARRIFRTVLMVSDRKVVPRRSGGLTAYFTGGGNAITESNKTWNDVEFIAKKLAAISRFDSEVGEDSVINFGDDLAGEIAYAFASKEDDCGFNGDGTSTYGGIIGVRAKLQDVDGAGTDSFGLVTAAGNAYSEATLANFHTVLGKLPVYARTPRTRWVVSSTVYHEVMERLMLASGGVPGSEIRDGSPVFRFLGYPVEISQQMPITEANTQVYALLGDFSLGAGFGNRRGETIMFSEHATVNGESTFERDQIAVRGTERFDIVVHDVGSSTVAGPIVGLQTAAS